jgi:hypothetical protein
MKTEVKLIFDHESGTAAIGTSPNASPILILGMLRAAALTIEEMMKGNMRKAEAAAQSGIVRPDLPPPFGWETN